MGKKIMANNRMYTSEEIGKLYNDEGMSISLIEYRLGISRDAIVKLLDSYDKKYNKEKYLESHQVNDLVSGVYLYKAKYYDIEGVISKKYTRACKVEITGGDNLPDELLNNVVVTMNSRLKVIEKDHLSQEDFNTLGDKTLENA